MAGAAEAVTNANQSVARPSAVSAIGPTPQEGKSNPALSAMSSATLACEEYKKLMAVRVAEKFTNADVAALSVDKEKLPTNPPTGLKLA